MLPFTSSRRDAIAAEADSLPITTVVKSGDAGFLAESRAVFWEAEGAAMRMSSVTARAAGDFNHIQPTNFSRSSLVYRAPLSVATLAPAGNRQSHVPAPLRSAASWHQRKCALEDFVPAGTQSGDRRRHTDIRFDADQMMRRLPIA